MAKKLAPVHPGEILREEFMVPLGLSQNRLAGLLRVPVTRLGEIVNERRAITSDTALRLGRLFQTTPEFWMNLQTRYDLELARQCTGATLRHQIRPLVEAAQRTQRMFRSS